MFSWLKKHFIPHAGNDHRPHILRDFSVRNILAIVIFLEIFSFLIPAITRLNFSGGMAAVLPAVLDDLTNVERKSQNLSVLAVSPILNEAARMKAEDMAMLGYFAHTSPAGKTPWYWIEKVGYRYQYAGENLAINFSDSKDVTNAWMNSPTHRANIIKENYTEIGTGVATGIYEGRETVFVAQVYANPLPVAPKPVVPVVKPQAKPPVKQPVKVSTVIPKEPTNILGAEDTANIPAVDAVTVTPAPTPTTIQKLIASPRNTTNTILNIIFAIVAVALLLYIFIKMRNHHKDLVTNGLVTLAVIGAVLLVNYYISYSRMSITDSFDYSVDSK
jgi:hypothetical protein